MSPPGGRAKGRILISLALAIFAVALALAARPHDETNAERIDRITSELRCPVCQGLSVKDSPSQTAREMRALVEERVNEGRSDAQIQAEFRAAYGDWVLLSPPVFAWTGLVWLVPLAALAPGFGARRARGAERARGLRAPARNARERRVHPRPRRRARPRTGPDAAHRGAHRCGRGDGRDRHAPARGRRPRARRARDRQRAVGSVARVARGACEGESARCPDAARASRRIRAGRAGA